jgi:hypothetical protein
MAFACPRQVRTRPVIWCSSNAIAYRNTTLTSSKSLVWNKSFVPLVVSFTKCWTCGTEISLGIAFSPTRLAFYVTPTLSIDALQESFSPWIRRRGRACANLSMCSTLPIRAITPS